MATQLSAPRAYDRSIATDILRRIAEGENTRAVMRSIGISNATLYNWMGEDPELSARYEEARLQGAHAIANEALAILDGDDLDELVPSEIEGAKGLVPRAVKLAAIGGDPVARARLRFEGRMKLLAKWFPQHYGDKLLHAGHDGGAIKSETALSVKELAAQLRARASGVVIDGDAKELLTDETERFNGTSVSNERQSDEPIPDVPAGRAQERRAKASVSRDGATSYQSANQGRLGSADSEAAIPVQQVRGLVGQAAVSDEGAGLRAGAAERGTVSAGAGGGKRRSRGAGGRGGALKRGASPETGGTPPTDIFATNSNTSATSYLHTPLGPRPRNTTPARNFSEKNQQAKRTNMQGPPPQSTTLKSTSHLHTPANPATPPEFPPDEDWAPEDYV